MSIHSFISLTEIFLVTYSILYGIMLNSCMGINLFPYGQLCKNPKAKKRLIISILFISILPIKIFALFFLLFEKIPRRPNFFSIIGVFFISLIVFVPYRFLQALIVSKPTCLYEEQELCRLFKNRLSEYSLRFKHETWEGHMWGVIIYTIFAVFGLALIWFF